MRLIRVLPFFVCTVKLIGSGGGSECKSAEKDFFNIIKKKKGSIRWSKTFDARKAFLNQCTTADPAAILKIMSKFGRSRVNHEKLIIIPTTLLLNACSHAPEPAQAKGGWYELENTTIEQVRADTYYNGWPFSSPCHSQTALFNTAMIIISKGSHNVTPAPRIAETVKPRSEQSATAPKPGSNNSFLKPTTNSITSSGEIKQQPKEQLNSILNNQHSPAKPISSNNHQAQNGTKRLISRQNRVLNNHR